MKPFNLEEYLANPSKKVITMDGRPVRIICTDAKGEHPVIGLVDHGNYEAIKSFTKSGRLWDDTESSSNDLFFVSKKHEGLINIFKHDCVGIEIYETQDLAKEYGIHHSGYVNTIKIEWEE